MNLKDIVDKLASIDKLEKMATQMDQKIPGQQTNLDPKADVTAMTQALSAVRGPAMSPSAAVAPQQTAQPAQAMTTEPPQQDAPPPERRELQQKNRPGEPMGEELIGEQEVPKEEFIKQAIERANENPEILWRLPAELRDTIRSSMTPEARNVADAQKAYVDATTRDPKNEKLQRDLLADLERARSALKPDQASTAEPTAAEPKSKDDTTNQSASSQEDEVAKQTRIAQELGRSFQAASNPDSGQSPEQIAATRQAYINAVEKLNTLKGEPTTPAATPDETPPAATKGSTQPKTNLGQGNWYRGSEGDYTIQKGDTLSSISKRTGVPVSQLARMNNIENPNKIVAGAKLKTGQDGNQTAAGTNRQEFGLAPTASNAPAATSGFNFTPEQEKWLGNANRQDPNILSRMPGPKPPLSYFTNPDDQARARELNQGNQNLTRIKNAFGGKNTYNDVFRDVQQQAPANPDQQAADAEIDRTTAALSQAEVDKQPAPAPTKPTADQLRQQAAGTGPDAAAARATIANDQRANTEKPEKSTQASPVSASKNINAKDLPPAKESFVSLKSIVDELLNRN